MQSKRPRRRGRPARTRRGELSSWVPIILVGLAAIGMVVGIVVLSRALEGDSGASGEVVVPPQATARAAPQSGSVLGDDDAPVTIVEYSWYNCHVCRDFTLDTLPQFEEDYIDTGKVRLELRPIAAEEALDELPLDASNAFLCAADQNRSADYHDVLFANFRSYGLDAYKGGRMKDYAERLGMDTDAFDSCIDDDQHHQEVLDMTGSARNVGIEATPTFFIGLTVEMRTAEPPFAGQTRIDGAGDYAKFTAAVDAVLAEAQ